MFDFSFGFCFSTLRKAQKGSESLAEVLNPQENVLAFWPWGFNLCPLPMSYKGMGSKLSRPKC